MLIFRVKYTLKVKTVLECRCYARLARVTPESCNIVGLRTKPNGALPNSGEYQAHSPVTTLFLFPSLASNGGKKKVEFRVQKTLPPIGISQLVTEHRAILSLNPLCTCRFFLYICSGYPPNDRLRRVKGDDLFPTFPTGSFTIQPLLLRLTLPL